MDNGDVTVGLTAKRKLLIALLGGFFLFGSFIAAMGFSGTVFAMPLGGFGDFHVSFDKLEGEGFTLNPEIGETGNESDAPLVRNEIDKAVIDNLHIYKDLKMPTGGWIRINIKANEPTVIEGLIQDARFIDADLEFDKMAIKQTNTEGMSDEDVFKNNWTHDAETVTISDGEIVTAYLFQNMVTLADAEIYIDHISEPNEGSGSGSNYDSGEGVAAGSNDGSSGGKSSDSSGEKNAGTLPLTASNLWIPIMIGGALLLGGLIILWIRKKRNSITAE
ncbi:MAG TPA: DUF6230 family protein [Virgibacillus sp.]|nr:DUF6230 family protein [Virgibacillus sp.]